MHNLRKATLHLAHRIPDIRQHLVPLLRTARHTEDWERIHAAIERIEKPLATATNRAHLWSGRGPITDEMVRDLAVTAREFLDVLVFEFENPNLEERARHFLARFRNLAKMTRQWAEAKTPEDLTAVLKAQTTAQLNPYQKFLEYSRELLKFIDFFDTDVDARANIAGYQVVFLTASLADWDVDNTNRLNWILESERRLLDHAGLGRFGGGTLLAYPHDTVSGHSTGTLAYYQTTRDHMALAVGGDPHRILQSLTHETGHRVYYRGLGSVGRRAWEEFFEVHKGAAPNVDRIIADWEAYIQRKDNWEAEKYGRYYSYYRGWLRKNDPERMMWLDMIGEALPINEDFQKWTGAPKKGTVPGLDQLIARKGEVRVFLHPVSAYSATNPSELFAEVFAHYLLDGPNRIPEIVRDAFHRAVPGLRMSSHTAGDHPVVDAWRAWAAEKNTARRRLVIQVINAERLAYAWQSFDTAVENFKFMGVTPDRAGESLREAIRVCEANRWNATAVRKALR